MESGLLPQEEKSGFRLQGGIIPEAPSFPWSKGTKSNDLGLPQSLVRDSGPCILPAKPQTEGKVPP